MVTLDYDRLRPLAYPDTDVVLLCYPVNSHESLARIESKWAPEVEHYCPGVPKLLVALKVDLRRTELPIYSKEGNPTGQCVTAEEGQAVADRINARYVECSAKYGEMVGEIFEMAVRAVWERERTQKRYRRKNILSNLADRCRVM